MTNEQPAVQRVLRRRADDRVIGGVASGLGDYFNVDPLLIRIVLVGLMVFGGMGIVLYLAAWLLIPDDATDRSIVERVLGTGGIGGTLLTVLGIFVVGWVLLVVVAGLDPSSDGFPFFGFALVAIVVGALILRRNEAPAAVPGAEASATEGGTATVERRAVRRVRREPSPLGGYVFGTALAAIGLLALFANLTGADVTPGHYFGLALGIVGIGLLVGAWWGHARGLVVLGLLLLPFAIPASFVTVPVEGGFGDVRYAPTSVADIDAEYRLAGGQMVIDLTELDTAEPVAIAASVAMGDLLVLVPDDAAVELDASVGAGSMDLFDARQSGTTLTDRRAIEGGGSQFSLDLDAGVGRIHVEAIPSEDR